MNSMNRILQQKQPWYRYPMVWLLVVPPLAAVIGGVIMISLAISSDDGLVADDYYHQGMEINRALGRDQKASDYALYAQLYWHDETHIRLQLQANNDAALTSENLNLSLRHPTREGFDQHLPLTAMPETKGLYQTELKAALPRGSWIVSISTDEWRLLGRLQWPETRRLALKADDR